MYRISTMPFRRLSVVCILIFHVCVHSVLGQTLTERQLKIRKNVQLDKNIHSFTLSEDLKTPSFIAFKNDSPYTKEKATELIRKYYELTKDDELKLQNNTTIAGGIVVERFKQYRNGIKVEHSAYVVTSKDSKIFSINSESFDLPASFSVKPGLAQDAAKTKVLAFVNAKQYAWQALEIQKSSRVTAEQAQKLDALITQYTPKGELVIAKALYEGGGARLAYKFDIYATEPLSRNLVYVDATSGQVLLIDPIIKHADKLNEKNEQKLLPAIPAWLPSVKPSFSKTGNFSAYKPFFAGSVLGTGKTRYAGVRNIFTTKLSVPLGGTVDPNNTSALLTFSGAEPRLPILTAQDVYILKDDTRGGGVETFDLNGIGGLPVSIPGLESTALAFVDKDNNWKDETAIGTNEDLMRGPTQPPVGGGVDDALNDDMAIDAHWGAEMVYDYWKIRHGRLSYDNANTSIRSYVHYGPAYDNAFWNGSVMTYGDGSGGTTGFKPLVSLDVCAHEIGHGVCSFTADLVYQSESGAMNEGLSDIWASALENYALLSVDNTLPYQTFQVGEQIDPGNIGLRRMDNPKAFSNPDSYGGTNWTDPNCTPSLVNDQCGVHNNSGVINKWFYLLVKGPLATTGSPAYTDDGVNDAGGNYGALAQSGFIGIGFEKAEKITYLMELMLTPNATYAEARTASINAAKILYGECSQEQITVTDSWFGVNVGPAFTSCSAPLLAVTSELTKFGEFAVGGCDRYTEYPITTNLTTVQSGPVTVNFAGTGGTLGAGEYQIIPSSVTYNAGEKGVKTVMLRIFDDATVEGDETLTVSATSALNSLNTTLTYTIVDNDVNPVIGGTVTLLNETFESTANNLLPANWLKVDKLTPSPVAWKVLSKPAVSLLAWTSKRAVIETPGIATAGQATYDLNVAAQTILRTPVINALGLSDVKISFTYSAGGEPACSPACDYGQLVYSLDGVNFSPFAVGSTPLYAQVTDATANVTLPASFDNKQFYLGFLWTNDASAGLLASVTIDDVLVTAVGKTVEGDLSATVTEKVFSETDKPVYFYSTSDNQLMASVKNASANLGCVTTMLIDAGIGSNSFQGGKRSKKAFQITPTSNSGASYTVSLYYKTTELASAFTGAASTLKLMKSNASTIEGSNTANSVIVTPVFEDHTADGYYKYSYAFTGFSKFFLVENVTLVQPPLPVTLVDFKVGKSENSSSLSWKTTSEHNSDYFDIERATDAVNFSAIGNVKSSQNSVQQKSYGFSDNAPAQGLNYYRLKMVDLDGTFAYSRILSVEFGGSNSVILYPNPVGNKLTVKFDKKEKASIRIMNLSGQVLKKKAVSGNSSDWDVSDLADGTYLIEISHENGMVESKKLIILH